MWTTKPAVAATKYSFRRNSFCDTTNDLKEKRMHVTGASYSIRFVFDSFVPFVSLFLSLCSVCIIWNIVSAWRGVSSKFLLIFLLWKCFNHRTELNWTEKQGDRKYLKLFSIGLSSTFLTFFSRWYLSLSTILFCYLFVFLQHCCTNHFCDFQVCHNISLLLLIEIVNKCSNTFKAQNKQLNLILG